MAAKEIKVRYKLPLLGFLWALLVPLSLSGILWLIFTYVVKVPMTQAPFFLFLMVGMFPWNFFAQSISNSTTSVLDAGPLIRKTAFPRVLIPLSIIAANLFNFLLALVVVIAVILFAGVPITPWMGLLPVALGLQLVLTTGIVLLVADLQVRYRDVKYLMEAGLLLWFYITPIFYPLELISRFPAALQALYVLNPCVGMTELYRLSLLGTISGTAVMGPWTVVGVSAVCSMTIFIVGLLTFRRHEATFADWVMG